MDLSQAGSHRSVTPPRRSLVTPAARRNGGPLARLLPEFEAACALAARCGLTGNQLVLSASRAVARTHGLDPLQLLGMTGLPGGEIHLSPSELGRHLKMTPRQVNAELERLGLQVRVEGIWSPTVEGRPHAVVVDVGKQHSDGAPVTQVRWRLSVIRFLDPTDLIAASCA